MGWLTRRRIVPFSASLLVLGLAVGFWLGIWFSSACHPGQWGPDTSLYLRMALMVSAAPVAYGIAAVAVRVAKWCRPKADPFTLRYPNTDIRPAAGDRVRYLEEPPEAMVVEEVIDTRERMARWGVSEPGLMLVGGAFGTVFEPLTALSEVVFVSRGEAGGPQPPDGSGAPPPDEGERPPGREGE